MGNSCIRALSGRKTCGGPQLTGSGAVLEKGISFQNADSFNPIRKLGRVSGPVCSHERTDGWCEGGGERHKRNISLGKGARGGGNLEMRGGEKNGALLTLLSLKGKKLRLGHRILTLLTFAPFQVWGTSCRRRDISGGKKE